MMRDTPFLIRLILRGTSVKLINVQWVYMSRDIQVGTRSEFNISIQRRDGPVPFTFPSKFSNSSQGEVSQKPFSFQPQTVTVNLI